MLVLSRKQGEAIHVGASIVRVLEVNGNRVRLGIEADPEVQILRNELIGSEPEPLDLVEV